MMRTLDQVVASLPDDQRADVTNKARRLIKAETLRQLRALARKTQSEVARSAGMSQYNISRLEHRDDMLLSTLDNYVAGLGGRLRLIAELPGTDGVEVVLPQVRARAGG